MEKKQIAVELDRVTVRFNLSSQKVDNLKEYVVRLLRGQLMFQEFLAVRNVSLRIGAGEAWGLVGSNGSGKSTLLKVISGILKPWRGRVSVRGTVAPLIELGAGFDPELTARENIFLNGCVLGHTIGFMREHFQEIVSFAEVEDFLDTPVKNFSSGMSARLGFAIATAARPDILIVDEILAVGDAAFRAKCRERMDRLLSGGTTLIFVSHSAEEIMEICDYALWIEKGEQKMVGRAEAVCRAYLQQWEKES